MNLDLFLLNTNYDHECPSTVEPERWKAMWAWFNKRMLDDDLNDAIDDNAKENQ